MGLRGLSFEPERTNYGPERADLGPERADLGPERGLGGTDVRTDIWTDVWKFTPVSKRLTHDVWLEQCCKNLPY